jgi:hypothetical protein
MIQGKKDPACLVMLLVLNSGKPLAIKTLRLHSSQ